MSFVLGVTLWAMIELAAAKRYGGHGGVRARARDQHAAARSRCGQRSRAAHTVASSHVDRAERVGAERFAAIAYPTSGPTAASRGGRSLQAVALAIQCKRSSVLTKTSRLLKLFEEALEGSADSL